MWKKLPIGLTSLHIASVIVDGITSVKEKPLYFALGQQKGVLGARPTHGRFQFVKLQIHWKGESLNQDCV